MGWTDSHLHQFEASGQLYGEPSADAGQPMKDEARPRLGQVLVRGKNSMVYEYDFGDSGPIKSYWRKFLRHRQS